MSEPVDNSANTPSDLPVEQAEAAPAASRSFITTGLLKGLAVTALAVVGVMALVMGTMGTGAIDSLFANGWPVTSFAEGVGHGINEAAKFLATSWIGMATLAVGGALGVYREYKHAHNEATATPDSPDHTQILELAKMMEGGKSVNKQQDAQPEKPLEQAPKDIAPEPQKHKKDDLYLAGSIIKDKDFSAGELKRRAEQPQHADTRVM